MTLEASAGGRGLDAPPSPGEGGLVVVVGEGSLRKKEAAYQRLT